MPKNIFTVIYLNLIERGMNQQISSPFGLHKNLLLSMNFQRTMKSRNIIEIR